MASYMFRSLLSHKANGTTLSKSEVPPFEKEQDTQSINKTLCKFII